MPFAIVARCDECNRMYEIGFASAGETLIDMINALRVAGFVLPDDVANGDTPVVCPMCNPDSSVKVDQPQNPE